MKACLLSLLPCFAAVRTQLGGGDAGALARAERAASFAGTLLDGRFQLRELLDGSQPSEFPWGKGERFSKPSHLGFGAYGEVWKAYDSQREEVVAVKLFVLGDQYIRARDKGYEALEEEQECLMVQAMLAEGGIYPEGAAHVCKCLEAHTTDRKADEVLFLVLEYCGESLDTLEEQRLEAPGDDAAFLSKARRWARGLLMALRFLNGLEPPVRHNDLHAGNVAVNAAGEAKLLDFGMARRQKGRARARNRAPWTGDVQDLAGLYQRLLCLSSLPPQRGACGDGSPGIGEPGDWAFVAVREEEAPPSPEELMGLLPGGV